ncbi:MAG TPA: hypothetical protein VFW50_03005 [Streptosporangiaceae bacterium]|nr:hypothetical protein [Streptosporangiaceae bacterium]
MVVVAPATAVAGAATTTSFRQGNIPGLLLRLTAGIRSRGEIIYAERGGFYVSASTDPALVG